MSGSVVPGTATAGSWRTKVWGRFAASLALLYACAGVAHAETAATWTFEVIEVSKTDRNEHRIRLRPRPRGRKFPRSCETFVVYTRFDLESWSPSGRLVVTREGHDRSLQLLQQAQVTRDIVRFGAVGRGFAAIAESPNCEVASRGLQIVVEDDGTSAVYSVFREPQVGPPRP
jgi:hypothetical protein